MAMDKLAGVAMADIGNIVIRYMRSSPDFNPSPDLGSETYKKILI
jgi:hypothetical protein